MDRRGRRGRGGGVWDFSDRETEGKKTKVKACCQKCICWAAVTLVPQKAAT